MGEKSIIESLLADGAVIVAGHRRLETSRPVRVEPAEGYPLTNLFVGGHLFAQTGGDVDVIERRDGTVEIRLPAAGLRLNPDIPPGLFAGAASDEVVRHDLA
jgi:hypothetical protein